MGSKDWGRRGVGRRGLPSQHTADDSAPILRKIFSKVWIVCGQLQGGVGGVSGWGQEEREGRKR